MKIQARHGVFQQDQEDYRVLDDDGLVLSDWGEGFSCVLESARLDPDEYDSADVQLVETSSGEEECGIYEPICGDEHAGIAVLDGYAYQFIDGTAYRLDPDTRWRSPNGDLYVVVHDGDGTHWREEKS